MSSSGESARPVSAVICTRNRPDKIGHAVASVLANDSAKFEQAQERIVSRQLLRVPYSYPVPTIGRDDALAVIQPWLMAHGIYSRGRFGAWRYEIGQSQRQRPRVSNRHVM